MSDSLSHSCQTCEGEGLEYPVSSFSESHPLPVSCPDCYEGYPKAAVERAAKAMHDLGRTSSAREFSKRVLWDGLEEAFPGDASNIKRFYRNYALAAIRAFHDEGSEE